MKQGKSTKPVIFIIVGMFIITMIIIFTVFMRHKRDYEIIGSFELYFLPDEYEEKYNEVSKTILLDSSVDYLFEITSICDTGTMTITVLYGEQQDIYSASNKNPCQEIIELVDNQNENIAFIIHIEPETHGYIKANISMR